MERFRKVGQVLLRACLVVLAGAVLGLAAGQPKAFGATNDKVSFQARVLTKDRLSAPTGSFSFRFALYNNAGGGSEVWSETYSGGNKIEVHNGLFTVQLGTLNSLSGLDLTKNDLYLEVSFDSDGNGTFDQTFGSRIPINAVPYALSSQKLAGKDESQFANLTENETISGNWTFQNNPVLSSSLNGVLKASSGVISGAAGLGDLNQVSLSNQSNGQILQWNGSTWVNKSLADAGLQQTLTAGNGININSNTIAVDYNATNLKITGSQLNTIQDISTTSSVQFGALTVTGGTTLATSLNGVLKATAGVISAGAADTDYQQPITWGDGLTYSAPTAAVDYNSTNLKITTGQINTIQNINTTANPQFSGIILTADLTIQSDNAIKLYDANNSNYVGFKSATNALNDVLWILPNDDGGVGQILATNGFGELYWADNGSSGGASTSDTFFTFASAADLTAERVLSFDSNNFSVTDGGPNSTYSVNTAQDIQTTSTPTFSALNLSASLNQLVLQSGGVTGTLTWTPASTGKTITLPNASGTVAVSASTPLSLSATGALTIADAVANGSTKGAASFTATDFDSSSGNISIDYTNGQAASGSTKGFLTAADWTTFNSKQAAGSYITSLTLAGTGVGNSNQTITNGDTITLAGGTDISTVAGATDTVTLNNTSTLSTITGRGASTNTSVALNGGITVNTSQFTVNGTTGATAIAAVNSAGSSLNAISLSGTLGAFDGSDTFRGIYLNYTNADHAGSSNSFYGLDIAGITADAQATERAINVGSGWDVGLYIADGATYSLQLASTDGDAASGITFGTDTNLYRSGANLLQTDDSLTVGTNLVVTGNTTLATSLNGVLKATSGVVSGSATLDDLNDVVITSVGDNELLTYDSGSGTWINQTAAEVGLIGPGGNLFTIAGDDDSSTIVQGGTLTIAGGADISSTQNAGTITVANSSTLSSVTGRGATTSTLVNLDGGIAVSTNKFTVNGTTGNVATAGDLDIAGTSVAINSSQTGTLINSWSTNANTPATAPGQDSAVVVYNGFIYALGGSNGSAQNIVYYAKFNPDGSIGTWSTTDSLPSAMYAHKAVIVNGYIYVVGGVVSSASQKTVYYNHIQQDGTLEYGTWRTAAHDLPEERDSESLVTYNNYIYVIGGQKDGTAKNTVYYTHISTNGATNNWTTSGNTLPGLLHHAPAVVANGNIILFGGTYNGSVTSNILYAPISTDGSIGSWTQSSNSLSAARTGAGAAVLNGYVYTFGGWDGATRTTTVQYAQLTSGSDPTDTWATDSSHPLTSGCTSITNAVVVFNGYIYEVSGICGAGTYSNHIYYNSGSRVKVASSLDLLGLTGQEASFGAGAVNGSIYAGNIYSSNNLDVIGQTNLAGNFNVQGDSFFYGNTYIHDFVSAGNSTYGYFQVGVAENSEGALSFKSTYYDNSIFTGATSGNSVLLYPTFSTGISMNGGDVRNILGIQINDPDSIDGSSGSGNYIRGINFEDILATSNVSEYAINIGDNWDAGINFEGLNNAVDLLSSKPDTSGGYQFLFNTSATISTASLFAVENNGTPKFTIQGSGNIVAPQVYANSFAGGTNVVVSSAGLLGIDSSSARFKEDISTLTSTDWVYDLHPVSFKYIADERNYNQIGLIAEEVAPIAQAYFPDLVSYDQDNPSQPYTVNYSRLVVPILYEVQNLHTKLSNDEVQLAKMQSKLTTYLTDNTLDVATLTNSHGDITLAPSSGQVTVKGKLTVEQGIAGASLDLSDQSAGRGTVHAGESSVFVETSLIQGQDKVLITPIFTADGALNNNFTLYRGAIEDGKGFWVNVVPDDPLDGDLAFDWLIVK